MTITPYQPSPDGAPSWIAIGVRAVDTCGGRVGIIQLLRDDLGSVRTGSIEQPTRVLLRPVGSSEPLWWVHIAHLAQPPGSER